MHLAKNSVACKRVDTILTAGTGLIFDCALECIGFVVSLCIRSRANSDHAAVNASQIYSQSIDSLNQWLARAARNAVNGALTGAYALPRRAKVCRQVRMTSPSARNQ